MSVTVDRTPIQQFKVVVAIILARAETRKNKLYSILDALSEYERAQKVENVIVPRKQLSDHLATFPFQSKDCPNEIKYYWCKNEYTTCFQYYHCEWFKTLKELVETSEHHFLTVSEAREKLKEASKEARP
jgi:hypothetical protein